MRFPLDSDTTAVERIGHIQDSQDQEGTPDGFEDFYLKAKARIWHWLSHMCRILSTADIFVAQTLAHSHDNLLPGVGLAAGGVLGVLNPAPSTVTLNMYVFKAHRLMYHSTLGLRVIKKKKK